MARKLIKIDRQCGVFEIDSCNDLVLGDVISREPNGRNWIVTGFTKRNIEVLDPGSGEVQYVSRLTPTEYITVWDARDPDFNTEPKR